MNQGKIPWRPVSNIKRYRAEETQASNSLTLFDVASHENFSTNLKKSPGKRPSKTGGQAVSYRCVASTFFRIRDSYFCRFWPSVTERGMSQIYTGNLLMIDSYSSCASPIDSLE